METTILGFSALGCIEDDKAMTWGSQGTVGVREKYRHGL